MKNCSCGAQDCWDEGDYSWLNDAAGWRGTVNGCEASIYWVHGKKIAEERHIPEFGLSLPELRVRLAYWCEGLESPVINWCHDTGGGDAGLWIRDVREPVEADRARLQEVRQRLDAQNRREYERLRALLEP